MENEQKRKKSKTKSLARRRSERRQARNEASVAAMVADLDAASSKPGASGGVLPRPSDSEANLSPAQLLNHVVGSRERGWTYSGRVNLDYVNALARAYGVVLRTLEFHQHEREEFFNGVVDELKRRKVMVKGGSAYRAVLNIMIDYGFGDGKRAARTVSRDAKILKLAIDHGMDVERFASTLGDKRHGGFANMERLATLRFGDPTRTRRSKDEKGGNVDISHVATVDSGALDESGDVNAPAPEGYVALVPTPVMREMAKLPSAQIVIMVGWKSAEHQPLRIFEVIPVAHEGDTPSGTARTWVKRFERLNKEPWRLIDLA